MLVVALPRPSFRARAANLTAEFRLDPAILGAFLVSRLLIVAAVFVAEALIIRNPLLTSGDDAPLLRSLTSWDGWYYLGIVRDGYHVDPVSGLYRDTAFPPLYPIVVRILSLPWPQFAGLVSVVVSNVAFLLSLGLLGALRPKPTPSARP